MGKYNFKKAPYSITLHVISEDGIPVNGARVLVNCLDSISFYSGVTNLSGGFTITEVDPKIKSATVTVKADGYYFLLTDINLSKNPDSIMLPLLQRQRR